MGRRDADPAGVDPPPEESSGAWEAVRRALGRVFTRAAVHRVADDRLLPDVSVRRSSATDLPLPTPGRREGAWEVEGRVRDGAIPRAEAGMGERGWQPEAVLAEADGAVPAPACRVLPTLHSATNEVRAVGLAWPLETARLPDEFVRLPSAPVRVQRQTLPALPPTRGVPHPGLSAPRTLALRLPRPPAPRVRWGGDAVLSRLDMTRRGREAPFGVSPDDAFPAERRRLAETAGLGPDDVTLLGIFPAVPILAVSRIVVDEDGGRLRLWLKPEALRGRGQSRLITLLVGRRASDGKMLQAAL